MVGNLSTIESLFNLSVDNLFWLDMFLFILVLSSLGTPTDGIWPLLEISLSVDEFSTEIEEKMLVYAFINIGVNINILQTTEAIINVSMLYISLTDDFMHFFTRGTSILLF